MQFVKPDVVTVCIGRRSAAAVLLGRAQGQAARAATPVS